MQKNKWTRKFDWVKSGSTYIQKDRSEQYNENRFIAVGDIYFKSNKYLTGVTYTYINSLENIYKTDLLTGDGYSIVNMYNEYDVIDRVLKNIVFVDVASDTNINIKTQWSEINNVKIKPGHLILLKNQDLETENDIYLVNNQYFLENANILSSREKSEKFSCSVRLGNNADKQFFLINNGLNFPTSFEPKYFMEGKSFILKNLIKYDLYNTSDNVTSKIIFTDYDFARKQLVQNYNLYFEPYSTVSASTCDINSSTIPDNYLTIDYHHSSYTIRSGTTLSMILTGLTSLLINNKYGTVIPQADSYYNVGDQINIKMYSGLTTVLDANSFIKEVNIDNYIIEDTIPTRVLNDLKTTYYSIDNLNIATDWWNSIDKITNFTPYSVFYSLSAKTDSFTPGLINIKISPKEYIYDKYFDYDGLLFKFNDDTIIRNFETKNHYINYKLFDRLNKINTGFTADFSFFNEYYLDGFNYKYTDNNRIKIITTLSGLTDIFKPYTYVYASGVTQPSQKTLVYSVSDYEIVIEKPSMWDNFPPPQITSIQNIDGLENISDILYEVYINQTYDWYVQKLDNERKYIAKSYGELLTQNSFLRNNVTGILYENKNNEFILKLYDLGPNVNGTGVTSDKNLYFSTIELVYIGADRKSRLPIPLNLIEKSKLSPTSLFSVDTFTLDWNILDSGFEDSLDGNGPSGVVGDIIDSGLNSILPGLNDPLSIYNIVDSGLDSV